MISELPVTVPLATTLVGVIAPKLNVKLGVEPPLLVPLTPLAVVTPIADIPISLKAKVLTLFFHW